ncbi:SDR family NAD(P)-dependent oxidoreductase [Paenibacillus sp. 1P07SE]|uniref:SDR family NAD(P)-dependent oxidoreductase n=1 Tax=Paenibacillus sp. 1P07SE TaxID=3132209 RepID=UPI0039A45616
MQKDNSNYVALVTGASSGIGLELTRKLLSEGWQVAALIRSDFPADDPQLQASRQRSQLRVYKADVSDYGSLRKGLEQIKATEAKLDVLFNNAGGSFEKLLFSPQGRELHYEVQTVAPYIITMELAELLGQGELKRIVNTSSNAFDFVKQFDPAELERPKVFKKLTGPYATAKLAMSLWGRAVAPQLEQEYGIRLRSVDPGPNNTLRKGKSSGLPFYVRPLMKLFFPPPTRGASFLYEGAMSTSPAGSLLAKGQVKELPFLAQGRGTRAGRSYLPRAIFGIVRTCQRSLTVRSAIHDFERQ